MCLNRVYHKEAQAKIIKKMTKKGGWITAYKVILKSMKAEFYPFTFRKGINVSSRRGKIRANDMELYVPCFHLWKTRKGAQNWCDCFNKTLKVKMRPSWITAIGQQGRYQNEVIVSRKIVI